MIDIFSGLIQSSLKNKIADLVLFVKMNELNSAKISFNYQTKFRLEEINKIKDYFYTEIQERKTIGKKLSKCIAAVDYIDKTLIILSATSGRISIISFTSVIGVLYFR